MKRTITWLVTPFFGGKKNESDDVASRLGLTPRDTERRAARSAAQGYKGAEAGAKLWRRPAWRLVIVGLVFVGAMGAAAHELAREVAENAAPPTARRAAEDPGDGDKAPRGWRADIVDRHGVLLAGSVRTFELYGSAQALKDPVDRAEAVDRLAAAFDDLDAAALSRAFQTHAWPLLRPRLTPVEAQRIHNLGIPGLYFEERYDRIYPATAATAHLLGYTNIDGKGQAGLEGALDDALTAFGRPPLRLSLDLRMQIAVREVLADGLARTSAKSAAAIVMSPETGEVYAMVSLPDYDPHDRALIARETARGARHRSPLFNRAVKGRYELGSALKIVTWALALETGVGAMIDVYPAPEPLRIGRSTISDSYRMPSLNFPMAFAKSSNVIAAQLALAAGRPAQKAFFERLGLHGPPAIELLEGRDASPTWTPNDGDVETATIAFGHGVAMSPLQLAETAASLVNGGVKVSATLMGDRPPVEMSAPQTRVVRPETSERMRDMLRLVVTDGTGKVVEIPGLEVGGKTGTGDIPNPRGGYFKDRVMASFVAAFPSSAPEAVVLVTLEEPSVQVNGRAVRGAGRTAAPIAKEVIARAAPLLGVAPSPGG